MRKPDREDFAGRVWRVNLREADPGMTKRGGTAARWVLELPEAHPVWHSYLLDLSKTHERPDGTNYTMTLCAMQIDFDRERYLRDLCPMQEVLGRTIGAVLMPANYVLRLACSSDEDAIDRAEVAVRAMVNGRLGPTDDDREDWETLYGLERVRTLSGGYSS